MDEIGREHFDEKFGGRPVAVQPAFCLNSRFKNVGCTLCAEECPAKAITLENGLPMLSEPDCIHCGACLAICPTDVFSQFPAIEDALIKTVGTVATREVALVCSAHPNAAASRAPVSTVVEHKHCLASLTVDRLLVLCDTMTGTLWLDDTPCATCAIGATHEQLHRTVLAANTLLGAAGRANNVQLLAGHSEPLPERATPATAIDGSQPPLSRRALFSLPRQRAAETRRHHDETVAPPSGSGIPVAERLPHRVPPSRRRLQQWWSTVPPAPAQELATATIPYANVEVDAAICSACGLCSRFCPTGALPFEARGDTFELAFQAALCIGCNICTLACPSGAVHLGATLSVAVLTAEAPVRVASGALVACITCGLPTAVNGATDVGPLCHVCSSAAKAPSTQAGRRRSLFDSLTRE